MQWWDSFVAWFDSDQGRLVVFGAIIPFVSIIVAGILGALIARGAVKRLVAQRDRETRASAVASLIAAGQAATSWHAQPPQTRDHFERMASEADIQVRLLGIAGAPLAADWAAHELNDMRVNSVSFSFQSEQTLSEYRERLLEWVGRPGRARKLFAADLDRWKYDTPTADPVVTQQQEWAEKQYTAETSTAPERRPEVSLPPSRAFAPAPESDTETRALPSSERPSTEPDGRADSRAADPVVAERPAR